MNLMRSIRFALRTVANVHRPGDLPDIFLFATPRGGSTWLMEILASQAGMKYYDEPLNPRRDYAGVAISAWEQLMPDTGDPERIVAFLQELQANKHGELNITPFGRYHRFLTNRIVFKIHEIEFLMKLVAQRCNGQIIYLLRHPIATSISRKVLPRLDLFLRSEHYAQLIGDSTRLREIRAIGSKGSQLQKAIVSWCFENFDALRAPRFDGLMVTYEELVLNPEDCSTLLAERFRLPDRAAMLLAFERPAKNIAMSHRQTIDVMQRSEVRARRLGLVTKWQSLVTPEQQQQAAQALELFSIDAYDAWQPLAKPDLLLFPATAKFFTAADRPPTDAPEARIA
jgi:hypothetical protein